MNSWVFSFPFSSQLTARLAEFGAEGEDALPSQTGMKHDVSLHTKEVQDEDDGACLIARLMVRLVASSLTPLWCLTPRQSPSA